MIPLSMLLRCPEGSLWNPLRKMLTVIMWKELWRTSLLSPGFHVSIASLNADSGSSLWNILTMITQVSCSTARNVLSRKLSILKSRSGTRSIITNWSNQSKLKVNEANLSSKKIIRGNIPSHVDMLHCSACQFKSFSKKSLRKRFKRFHENP